MMLYKLCYTNYNDMSEVVSYCSPHKQLWVSIMSKMTAQWLEVDSNLQPSSNNKAENIPLYYRIPL